MISRKGNRKQTTIIYPEFSVVISNGDTTMYPLVALLRLKIGIPKDVCHLLRVFQISSRRHRLILAAYDDLMVNI